MQVLGHLARRGGRVVTAHAATSRRCWALATASTSGGCAISAIRPDIAPCVSVIAVTSRGLRVASRERDVEADVRLTVEPEVLEHSPERRRDLVERVDRLGRRALCGERRDPDLDRDPLVAGVAPRH